MFAVRIRHPVTADALGDEREEFDEALLRWCGWLETRAGLIAIVVLDEGSGEISLMTFWLDQEAFAAGLGDPEALGHAGPLGTFITAPSQPEAVPVLYFGVGA